MAKDHNMSARVSPDGKKKLDAMCAQKGMKQKEVLGRMIDWIMDQDDAVRTAAMELYPTDSMVNDALGSVFMRLALKFGAKPPGHGSQQFAAEADSPGGALGKLSQNAPKRAKSQADRKSAKSAGSL